MKLVICDDEVEQQERVTRAVQDWGLRQGEVVQVLTYGSAEALLFDQEAWKDSDGLILDIEMKVMNGMQLAREIRLFDPHIALLFVTGYEDYVFEGYEVGALNYLIKPLKQDKLDLALSQMLKQSASAQASILVEGREGMQKISLRDILYVESDRHTCRIRTTSGDVVAMEGISTIGDKLCQDRFVAPHRSYIVNLDQVKRMNKQEIILENGAQIPIARGKWESVNQSYLAYFRRG